MRLSNAGSNAGISTAARATVTSGNTSGGGFSVPAKELPIDSTGSATEGADSPRRVATKDISASIVADLIIEFCHEHGDVITNMHLQRLLYFAQAWHLAIHDQPLFPEPFEAWSTGPVQPNVYRHFSDLEHRPIVSRRPKWQVPKKIQQHLYDLMTAYGTLSAFELELQAQRDLPWAEARADLPLDAAEKPKISNRTMKTFYRKRLKNDGQKGKGEGEAED